MGIGKEKEKNKTGFKKGCFEYGEEGHWPCNCEKRRRKNQNVSTVKKQGTWHGNAL